MPRIREYGTLTDLQCPVVVEIRGGFGKRNTQPIVCPWSIKAPQSETLAERSLVRLLGGNASSHLRLSDTNQAELAIAEHLAEHSPADWLLTLQVMRNMIEDLEDALDAEREKPDTRELGTAKPNLGTGRT